MTDETIAQKARQVAAELDDIHFNSRSGSWMDDASKIVEAALLWQQERDARKCEETAQGWVRGEATTVYGQAWQAGCNASAAAIRQP